MGWRLGGQNQVIVTNAPGLTHPSLSGVVAGGHAMIGVWDNEWLSAVRELETPLTSGPYYFGFLMNTGNSDQDHARVYLQNEDGNYQVGAGIWNESSTWQLTRRNGANGWGEQNSGVNVTSETTYFVLRLENNDRWEAALFVNPADADALEGEPDVSYNFGSGSSSEVFKEVRMQRKRNMSNPAPDRVLYDEIRVGTTPQSMFVPAPQPAGTVLIVM